ncbi:hypothetical protein [Aeromicrobium sp.]|uniref:hypothetical protein n=1 Tax=Aeromicrobium sp. TaxID=1871063 RepID=UPI0030C06A63
MDRSPRDLGLFVCVLLTACVALGGCSSDPAVVSDPDLACDRDRTSLRAKDIVERVGGLTGEDYVVRFAQSTRLGVVALIDGDTSAAYKELSGDYDVALVAQIEGDSASVTGFEQVKHLVGTACD